MSLKTLGQFLTTNIYNRRTDPIFVEKLSTLVIATPLDTAKSTAAAVSEMSFNNPLAAVTWGVQPSMVQPTDLAVPRTSQTVPENSLAKERGLIILEKEEKNNETLQKILLIKD